MSSKILIVDDEQEIVRIIQIYLDAEGYTTETAYNGKEALFLVDNGYDLILLDVAMPVMDGIETCKEIRKSFTMPILFLTAKISEEDALSGFSSGADDYICKPFSLPILHSHIQAALRRYKNLFDKLEKDIIQTLYFRFDAKKKIVSFRDKPIKLTPTEFAVFFILASHPGRVFTFQELYEKIWREPYHESSSNTLMVHINKLRRKIDCFPIAQKCIVNVWGKGYTFTEIDCEDFTNLNKS